MQHNRLFPTAVFGNVASTETAWRIEIDLNRAALQNPTHTILERAFNFRPVERTLTWHQFPRQASGIECIFQRFLRLIPDLIRTDALFRAGRQSQDDFIETKISVDRKE